MVTTHVDSNTLPEGGQPLTWVAGWQVQCLVARHSWQLSRDIVGTTASLGGRPCRRRSSSSPPWCWKDAAKVKSPATTTSRRTWVQQLVRRYQTEGNAAFAPRSRRPHHNPRAVPIGVEDKIVRLRKTLDKQGFDAGAATIAEHLARDPAVTKAPATSTIWRILKRRGFVVPQPHKRPRCAWKRFQADLPNELWQADVTHSPGRSHRGRNPRHPR